MKILDLTTHICENLPQCGKDIVDIGLTLRNNLMFGAKLNQVNIFGNRRSIL